RARPARLRGGAQSRLPDHVRDALLLHADRPGDEPGPGHHLHADRSAHRLRGAPRMTGTDAIRPAIAGQPPRDRFLGIPITPLTRRRLHNFRANRRGFWSLWIFLALFGVSLFAEFIANDKPLLVSYEGELYYPIFNFYPETEFGGEF